MKISSVLCSFLTLAASALASPSVHAQVDRQMRIVVPTTAGGPLDVVGRALASGLARRVDHSVIVENRPGAGAIIGTEFVVKAPADGRTLLLASGFLATNSVLNKLAFDPLRDLVPVVELSQAGMIMVVRQGLDARHPADLPNLAKRQAGGLNCAAPPGEMALACEQLKQLLGGQLVVVPYPGVAPAMNALIGGQVDIMLAPYDAVLAQLPGDRIVPLASTGNKPSMAPFDRLPLLMDTWPGFTVIGFLGVFAPAGTPPETVRLLNRHLNQLLKEPQLGDFMKARGSTLEYDSPPGKLGATMSDRMDYYRRVVVLLGLKPQ